MYSRHIGGGSGLYGSRPVELHEIKFSVGLQKSSLRNLAYQFDSTPTNFQLTGNCINPVWLNRVPHGMVVLRSAFPAAPTVSACCLHRDATTIVLQPVFATRGFDYFWSPYEDNLISNSVGRNFGSLESSYWISPSQDLKTRQRRNQKEGYKT